MNDVTQLSQERDDRGVLAVALLVNGMNVLSEVGTVGEMLNTGAIRL